MKSPEAADPLQTRIGRSADKRLVGLAPVLCVLLLTLFHSGLLPAAVAEPGLPNAPVASSIGCLPATQPDAHSRILNNFALQLSPCSFRFSHSAFPSSLDSQAKPPLASSSSDHRFWDRRNAWLFSAVGASRALDYSSTLNFRRRGLNEAFLNNDIVDNHPAFAAIEVGATAVSIGASYLFHRYHHHRLERWTSMVHASAAFAGDIRNYCLKTPHPSTNP